MISITTNLQSMMVRSNLRNATNGINATIERMTTGFKLNRAKDNAAGVYIANSMVSKLSSFQVAYDNADIGLSYLSTAEGNLDLVSSHLQRVRALTEQAANGTYSPESRNAIQAEINERLAEIDRVLETAEYNGIKIFKDSSSPATFSTFAMRGFARVANDTTFTLALSPGEGTSSALNLSQKSITTDEQISHTLSEGESWSEGSSLGLGYNIEQPLDSSLDGEVGGVNTSTAEETPSVSTFSFERTTTIEEDMYVANVDPAIGFTNGETYYIDNLRDLTTLRDLVNSGVDTTNITFELTQNITVSKSSNWIPIGNATNTFKGIFNGNGYTISNVTISTSDDNQGLFGCIENATIENLGIINANITGGRSVGGIVARASNSRIENCYISNSNIKGEKRVGGLAGITENSTIKNCYTTGYILGQANNVGGLIGMTNGTNSTTNCYSNSTVNGDSEVGGLVGYALAGSVIEQSYASGNVNGNSSTTGGFVGSGSGEINNCFSTGNVNGNGNPVGGFIGSNSGNINNCLTTQTDSSGNVNVIQNSQIKDSQLLESLGFSEANGWQIINGIPLLSWQKVYLPKDITFFVGIDGRPESQIGVNTKFEISLSVNVMSANNASSALEEIDVALNAVNAKQTEIGASSNRLESVLDSITTSIENLTSSLSTIRDADIAKESTDYIKQQILQNACATLLSTANQTPSIALSLI